MNQRSNVSLAIIDTGTFRASARSCCGGFHSQGAAAFLLLDPKQNDEHCPKEDVGGSDPESGGRMLNVDVGGPYRT